MLAVLCYLTQPPRWQTCVCLADPGHTAAGAAAAAAAAAACLHPQPPAARPSRIPQEPRSAMLTAHITLAIGLQLQGCAASRSKQRRSLPALPLVMQGQPHKRVLLTSCLPACRSKVQSWGSCHHLRWRGSTSTHLLSFAQGPMRQQPAGFTKQPARWLAAVRKPSPAQRQAQRDRQVCWLDVQHGDFAWASSPYTAPTVFQPHARSTCRLGRV